MTFWAFSLLCGAAGWVYIPTMSDYQPSGPTNPAGAGGSTPPPPPPGAGAGCGSTPPPTDAPTAGGSQAYVPPAPGGMPQGGPGYGAMPQGGPGYGGMPQPGGRRPGELLDRFLARLMDHVLIGIVNAIIVSVVIVGAVLGSDGTAYFGYGDSILAGIVSAVLSVAISLGYFVYMETQQGRTLGKMVMKLHVEGAAGGKPTVQESVKRNIWLALPLAGIVPFVGGLIGSLGQLVAVIMIAVGINSDQQRRQPWTDKFAGTQVIKEG